MDSERALSGIRILDLTHYREEKPSERRGNALVAGVPGGAYPCAPGGPNDYAYIYVQPINPEMWRAFASAIGREDLLADPRFNDAKTRWSTVTR